MVSQPQFTVLLCLVTVKLLNVSTDHLHLPKKHCHALKSAHVLKSKPREDQ